LEDSARIRLEMRRGDILDGKYRVDRVLGSGGMGVVIAAHHLGLDQKVAIKLLLPEVLDDPEAAARFEREARAAAKIKGEHIARVMDVGTLENGSPYMVMEHLEGEDLAARLRREGRLAIDHAVELILQTCEVLAEAHGLGIVHRDLKPANLFCLSGPEGDVSIKVLDFGISKVTGPNTSHTTITKTSTLMGSPTYMSPEQIHSARRVDARTDIWSIGIILYELLTGKLPFDGESVPEICLKVTKRSPPPIRRFRAETPSALEAAISKCLEKDRTKRFGSIADLSIALAPFGADKAQLSIDRIAQLARSARGRASAFPSAFPIEQSSSRGRKVPVSWWKTMRWQMAHGKWAGAKGAMVATALGMVGIALIGSDLILSKSSAPAAGSSSPVAARSTAFGVGVLPQSQLETLNLPQGGPDCRIDLKSVPDSTVSVDGHKVGTTPKLDFVASPGAHIVVFEHPVHGRLTTNVECKAGETKSVNVRLGRSTDVTSPKSRK
jgi:serine/threonine protein kinase